MSGEVLSADFSTRDMPALAAMKAKSKAKREELSALPADAFERAFINAMVQDHTEVLAKIDNELLPNATDAEVARHLRDTRTHIAKHLEHAKKLSGSQAAMR
jgi:putative membrane protein